MVVTSMDHACNVGPWEALARDTGAQLGRIVVVRVPGHPGTWTLDEDSDVKETS